jgi:hypothetical protein
MELNVSSYLLQIHISEPISTKLCTHLPLAVEETVVYVWTHNIPPSLPFRLLLSRSCARCCAEDACRRKGHPPKRYIRDSGTCSCDVTRVRSNPRHLRLLTSCVLHALRRQRFVRDSGKCSCDVMHTTSWRATVSYSYSASLALWVMHRKRGEDNGTQVRQRENLMAMRGGE